MAHQLRDDGAPGLHYVVADSPASGFVSMTQTRKDGGSSLPIWTASVLRTRFRARRKHGRQRSVTVGPMKKGEVREGVELRLPAMATSIINCA